MLAIEDVPMWLILHRSIGHALVSSKNGWHSTACKIWTPNGEPIKNRPPHICGKCRRALREITVTKG